MRTRTLAACIALVLVAVGTTGCLGDEAIEETTDPNTTPSPSNITPDGTQTVRSDPVNGSTDTVDNRTQGEDGADDPPIPLRFSDPLQLNSQGFGFEPGIEVGPEGTVYATAARGLSQDSPDHQSSWLWYKTDNESGWSRVSSPAQVHEKQAAFEGDVAVDDQGRLYFVDTNLVDNTLSRWSAGSSGPEWDFSRPLQGSTGIDDRPWVAAHGDGIVYYAGNNGAAPPAANNLASDPGNGSRFWVYTSEDAGVTWSPGHGFANSGWCTIAASPADDQTVYVGCDQAITEDTASSYLQATPDAITVFESTDRGATWEAQRVARLEYGLTDGYPNVAVDAAGTPYIAWPDGDYSEGSTTRVKYAYRDAGGAWQVHDITPFEGSFDEVWASGGQDGTLALTFYGTEDTEPDGQTDWFAYAAVTDDATAAVSTWQVSRIDPDPVGTGSGSPDDFFQSDLGPDDRLHVTYQRDNSQSVEVLYALQEQGPNLET